MTHFSFVPRHDFRELSRAAIPCRSLALALAVLIANFAPTHAGAQIPSTPLTASDPLNASTAVPVVQYESAFARYRPIADTGIAPWRVSNDTAMQRGGWRVYAREAAAPDEVGAAVKPASAPTSTTPPATVASPVKTNAGGTHVHSAH
jgi:hypothetical protein